MIHEVTCWLVQCNRCGQELSAPRAQDYWTSLDDLDDDLAINEWTSSGPTDDDHNFLQHKHYCQECSPLVLEVHGMDCCWDCFHGRRTHMPSSNDCGCAWSTTI